MIRRSLGAAGHASGWYFYLRTAGPRAVRLTSVPAERTLVPRLAAMPVSNSDIARIFTRYATLLQIDGANPFRVRAYQNAARLIQGLPKSIADSLAERADLTELEGIGEDLAAKMREIVATGRLGKLEEIEKRMPAALVELTTLRGLGPKRVKLLYDTLKTRTLEDLERAARAGRIREIRGFGPKTEEKILQAIAQRRGREVRLKWIEAEQVAEPLVRALESVPGVKSVVIAGSFRRCRETVGDLDILATCGDSERIMQHFVGYEDVAEVVESGTTRATIRLRNGLQVDLRVVPEASSGAALQYFTGSKAHNIALRTRAAKHGFKLSEYGLFKGKTRVAGRTEQEIYRRLKLPYIEPELREDHGEIAAAEKSRLPKLVTLADLRGDLHCHTTATDGRDTLETMARRAQELGYEYIAISDHTRHLRVANGLDSKRLSAQLTKIDRLNEKLERVRVLKSAEVDILDAAPSICRTAFCAAWTSSCAPSTTSSSSRASGKPSGSSARWTIRASTSWPIRRAACSASATPMPSTWSASWRPRWRGAAFSRSTPSRCVWT